MIYRKINSRVIGLLASSIAAGVLIGCGGGGDSTTSTTPPASSVPTGTYTVSVIDDNVVGATVSAPECATFSANGGGSYTLKECIAAPSTIIAVGGFVDVDGDGTQDADEASQTAPLMLKVSQSGLTNNFAVTPLSTLASQETDLAGLASALGVTQADLFQDNAANRNLMRSVNAVLISAREAGITKYDEFVGDLKTRIKASGSTGITALTAAKDYMSTNLNTYKSKYGVVFGGFVSDASSLDLTTNPLAQVKTKNTPAAGKVRLGGFVYDNEISNAVITIYDGTTVVGTGSSDDTGRYQIEIDAALLTASKVLKLEALSGTTKLIAYLTTDELKAGNFGSKVSSGTVEDLVISNVTTAKAVMVDKISTTANTNAATMTQTKAIVETMYANNILKIASDIKAVIDGGELLSQTDTLALAVAVANGAITAYTDYSTAINADPILSGQLNSTQSFSAGTSSMRTVIEGKTFYQFDYSSEFSTTNPFTYGTIQIRTDGSLNVIDYRNDANTSWIVYANETQPAGTIKWSSDGSTLYNLGDYWAPSKSTLISKETITVGGMSANIYFMRDEVTAEPTEGFYTHFETTANDEGIGSYDPTTKLVTSQFPWDSTPQHFYLGNNGYLQWNSASGTNMTIPYQMITKYGRQFLVVQWNNASGTNIYYMANGKVYQKDYDPIGTVETSWFTDSPALLLAWKEMTPEQRYNLQMQIPTSYDWEYLQKLFYNAIKTLIGA